MGFNLEKLAEMAKPRSDKAPEVVQRRRDSREWLRMSQDIALCLHYYLRKMKMTQKDLSEKLGVSPTYVGKLLKGQENLTLETISNLQRVIGQELISVFHPYEYKDVLTKTHMSVSKDAVYSKNYCGKMDMTTEYSPVSGDVA